MSDGAILEIYTLQALEGTLMVGPYSRFGWHHPGPLYFYVAAPWYWMSGYHTAGLQAAALAINLGAVAAIAWTVARFASAPVAIAVAAVTAWYTLRTGDLVVSVWNPHVIVLPMLAFVIMAAAFAATGRGALLLWLVLFGSFLVQTHLAMAPLVALVGATAVVAQRQALGGVWLRACLVALVLWLPPIVEQVTHTPGNLTRIVTFFAGGSSSGPTLGDAVVAWSASTTAAFRPDFAVALGFDFRPPQSAWPVVWAVAQVVLLAAAAAVGTEAGSGRRGVVRSDVRAGFGGRLRGHDPDSRPDRRSRDFLDVCARRAECRDDRGRAGDRGRRPARSPSPHRPAACDRWPVARRSWWPWPSA